MPQISIIIITFNSIKFIRSCLDSVFAQDYRNPEVIVVDNGSRDGTVGFLKENYPQIKLIENKENLGAAKAKNQGIEVTQGAWVLTLDCDIILEKDFLKEMLIIIGKLEKSVGMLQPKILRDDRKTIYSCGIYLSKIRRFFDIGKCESDNGQFDQQRYIFGSCSAAAFYKREMLEEIKEDSGYFDERFFFLVEDVDLAWRAQRKGWQALYYPSAVCYHLGNSSNASRKTRQNLCFRNRYLMIKKNETLLGRIELFSLSSWYEISHAIYLLITNRYLWKSA